MRELYHINGSFSNSFYVCNTFFLWRQLIAIHHRYCICDEVKELDRPINGGLYQRTIWGVHNLEDIRPHHEYENLRELRQY